MTKAGLTNFLLFVLQVALNAQNLVPNGDFETFKKCPSRLGQIKNATGWKSPSKKNADYFHSCSNTGRFGHRNYMGMQSPQNGKGYVGLVLATDSQKKNEFIQIKLAETLTPREKYRISFWVSFAEKSKIASDAIGCILTAKAFRPKGTNVYEKPHVSWTQGNLIVNQSEWVEVSGTFMALGIEKYLTIGNFYGSTVIDHSANGNQRELSYYYIDNVTIAKDTGSTDNLVANGDFEDFYYCPSYNISNISAVPYWNEQQANHLGTADYFNECSRLRYNPPPLQSEIPQALSGNGFAGINITAGKKIRGCEYLQGVTKEPLKKGQAYCFQMYVKMERSSKFATNTLGIYFSESSVRKPSTLNKVIRAKAQINTKGRLLQHTKDWICLSGTFVANGAEQYLTIGDFEGDFETQIEIDGGKSEYGYYYIDNVSLLETLQDSECTCPEEVKQAINKFEPEKTYTLNNVHFQFGKSILVNEAIEELDNLAKFLIKDRTSNLIITGHTDNIGEESSNLQLSKHRAKAVVDYLIDKGIETERLTYSGLGSSQPIADNDTEKGRKQNRRVDFTIKTK